jgi:hypothetical protein
MQTNGIEPSDDPPPNKQTLGEEHREGFMRAFGPDLGAAWFDEGLSWYEASARRLGLYIERYGHHLAVRYAIANLSPAEAQALFGVDAIEQVTALRIRLGEQAEAHALRIAAMRREHALELASQRIAIQKKAFLPTYL